MIWRYLWDYKRVSLKENKMATYAPIIVIAEGAMPVAARPMWTAVLNR